MPTAPKISPTKRRSTLSMEIYSAMLGGAPEIDRPIPEHRPRLKMRVRLEAKLEHSHASLFHRTTLREHFERCAAYAVRALDDARARLADSRPQPKSPSRTRAVPDAAGSIFHTGPAVKAKASVPSTANSRAA